jgi:hypothetical protein
MEPELIAPCGINCALCSGYRAFFHQTPRARGKIAWCKGCRPRNKQCAFFKKRCERLKTGAVAFCTECPDFPCELSDYLDEKYREHYSVSPIRNLEEIRDHGIEWFLDRERERHRCARCGGVICVHNRKCYACDEITSWRG